MVANFCILQNTKTVVGILCCYDPHIQETDIFDINPLTIFRLWLSKA